MSDLNGDGLLDMHIDETARAVGELRGAAETLGTAVTNAFTEIDSLTGRLGKGGTMSDEFMASYRQWRHGEGQGGLDSSVKDVAPSYHKLADVGEEGVATYRAAEQSATNQFQA